MDLLPLVLSALTGAFFGFISSSLHEWIRGRTRKRGISGALLADLGRIRRELGEPSDDYVEAQIGGSRPIIPQIHSWVRDLIPEASSITPAVVSQFLNLEGALSNLAISVTALRDLIDLRNNKKLALAQAESDGLEEFPNTIRMRNETEELEVELEVLHRIVVDLRKRAWVHMEEIEKLLRPYLPRSHRKKLSA